ncbi:hypothetical protein L1887_24233 [Cichorium endivia]|nr:hypothetical protein L1887_24233 [Cichorium endivia]
MASESDMNDAIAALDGQELEGRAIRVNEPMMIVEQTGDGRYYCCKEVIPFAAMVTRNLLCRRRLPPPSNTIIL